MSRAFRLARTLLIGVFAATAAVAAHSQTVGSARLRPLAFTELAGWAADDHAAAFAAFRRSCERILAGDGASRPAKEQDVALTLICREAQSAAAIEPRAFFEQHFQPFEVIPPEGRGFLTGYYEPEFVGSRERTGPYQVPLLARPDDLVTIPPGERLPGIDSTLQAARRTASGFEPYPERAAIETGALGGAAKPIVFLAEPAEAFIIHVQGSARIRLTDGSALRVAFAGKNGHPYTSIGRILVDEGKIPLQEMSLERLMGWLKDHPDEARALMRSNRSYIFFREAKELSAEDGPIGGAGHPLVPRRSLAVDSRLWTYGLPFWLEGELPVTIDRAEPLARLMIAQDTGSAIVGPARGDFFWGTGTEAGARAGLLRHRTRFVVLLPRP
jgi:membrane-bound lytic murein transglycosylase A